MDEPAQARYSTRSDMMLEPYRVLDLTDEKGFFCGKVLGDLGADVIKVEPPGGCRSRMLRPFYKDDPSPEHSLFWLAYNTSKRGITLNLDDPKGKGLFERLVNCSDFIIESASPGRLDRLGLSYEVLEGINPQIIVAAITPFGQSGPRAHHKDGDIVAMAAGGQLFLTGDPERPPVRVHGDLAYLEAGIQAAMGCLTALLHRRRTGEGQYIDVSIQESIACTVYSSPTAWDVGGVIESRMGSRAWYGAVYLREVWPCKDGHVIRLPLGGAWGAQDWYGLVSLMEEDGLAGPMKEILWEDFDLSKAVQEEVDQWEVRMERFFLRHTVEELEEKAGKAKMRLVGVKDISDIVDSPHLKQRGYWRRLEYPDLEESLDHPGFLFHSDVADSCPKRRAPRVGEHNKEVYMALLGLSESDMCDLERQGVI